MYNLMIILYIITVATCAAIAFRMMRFAKKGSGPLAWKDDEESIRKELNRMKANFVANVTHELRTPLVAIQKSLALLSSEVTGQTSVTQKQFLVLAERNLKRLSMLIDDLLELSELEMGKIELKREPISLESLINEAIEGLDTWAETKAITIDKRIQKGMPGINADHERLLHVMNNLIGNAVKFTSEEGNIAIEANYKKDSGEIRVNVANTGMGISREELGKVFDKFYQEGERMGGDPSGMGLGLAIAKRIIELHGGKLSVKSREGRGTNFIFVLPINNGG
ncbi:MAG: hypothetical protein COS99_02090 [Candidatus Omnitrophica bacterium CG07_land_8_20_14_0_80_42_15]|uniref:histidine kinase n=1 Tax=Candidatus Aquitaenariimonas noxiae TaxID=1974741 RepID=A0A2J0L0A8_9BACT|nr:MAG: hypothetical protein COS99_02090 [Candidatus Omnitrophica bacterium CG07_land_8_20_14_0_80_42_15]